MTTSAAPLQTSGFDQSELVAVIPRMRAFARSLCRDQTLAEDLTQDALVSAWRRRDSFTRGTNLRAWVFMIVRNQFYSDKRRSWRVSQLDPTVAEETLMAVSSPSAALELDDLRRAMQELPDEQREALILVAAAEMPYAEVARICGCAEGTIKSRVSRGRRRLQEVLARGEMAAAQQIPGLAMSSILANARDLRVRLATVRPHVGGAEVDVRDDRLVPLVA